MRKVMACIPALALVLAVACAGEAGGLEARRELSAKTENVQVKIFASSKAEEQMIVEQRPIVFKQDLETENLLINVYPEFKYQKVLGFGAAFTETSAYNFSMLSPKSQQEVIEHLFGKNGIRLNFCRTHINSSDFSLSLYTYVEEGDKSLETFNIDREREHVLPMVKAALEVNPDMLLFASPWSPPGWMKDNNSMIDGGRLLPEYYPAWAKYFSLYLSEFKKEGVEFFAVTIQNESMAKQTWESCIWTGEEEGIFAVNHLRPTLDKDGFGDVNIAIWDHNKERVMDRARDTMDVPGADKAIWGIAHHWYSGDHFDNLRMARELFPDKVLIASENNLGGIRGNVKGREIDWGAVEIFALETIMDFNNFTSAIIAWNLIVDWETGGPFHDRPAGVSAPVFYEASTGMYILGKFFHTIGHFSKFIERDAVRIGTSSYSDAVKVAAFSNPGGEVVVVVLNMTENDITPKLRLNDCTAEFAMPAKSLYTMIIPKL